MNGGDDGSLDDGSPPVIHENLEKDGAGCGLGWGWVGRMGQWGEKSSTHSPSERRGDLTFDLVAAPPAMEG